MVVLPASGRLEGLKNLVTAEGPNPAQQSAALMLELSPSAAQPVHWQLVSRCQTPPSSWLQGQAGMQCCACAELAPRHSSRSSSRGRQQKFMPDLYGTLKALAVHMVQRCSTDVRCVVWLQACIPWSCTWQCRELSVTLHTQDWWPGCRCVHRPVCGG